MGGINLARLDRRAKQSEGHKGSKHIGLSGPGDASDANDAEKCISSITKSSGDYLDCLLTRDGSFGGGQERGDCVTGNATNKIAIH